MQNLNTGKQVGGTSYKNSNLITLLSSYEMSFCGFFFAGMSLY